jgi:hypothetical protein
MTKTMMFASTCAGLAIAACGTDDDTGYRLGHQQVLAFTDVEPALDQPSVQVCVRRNDPAQKMPLVDAPMFHFAGYTLYNTDATIATFSPDPANPEDCLEVTAIGPGTNQLYVYDASYDVVDYIDFTVAPATN